MQIHTFYVEQIKNCLILKNNQNIHHATSIKGGEIMTDIELKIDAEPKDNYEKAKKLLFETDKAIQTLTTQEQQKLVVEFAEYKGMYGLYQMMQQYFG